jgi:CMP/dCMP kinase
MEGITYRIPRNLIITIDGPSGAGKSTVAKMLARSLLYTYIDTGAMYRGVAYGYVKRQEATGVRGPKFEEDQEGAARFLEDLSLRFEFGAETKVYLDGEEISGVIREPVISMLASRLSQNGQVRQHLYSMQRAEGRSGGIVLEGRDTGSVVFPDADVKFYLDANADERARRRYLELSGKGEPVDAGKVKEEMVERDRDDSERDLAPLVIPEGATVIDTTGKTVEEVVSLMIEHIAAQVQIENA